MEKITFKLENTETLNKLEIAYELQESYLSIATDDITTEFYTNATIESIFNLINSNKYGILEGGAYSENEMLSYFLTELKKEYTLWGKIVINNNYTNEYDFFESHISDFSIGTMYYNKDISLKLYKKKLYYYKTGQFEITYNLNNSNVEFTQYENYSGLDTTDYLKIIEMLSKLVNTIF